MAFVVHLLCRALFGPGADLTSIVKKGALLRRRTYRPISHKPYSLINIMTFSSRDTCCKRFVQIRVFCRLSVRSCREINSRRLLHAQFTVTVVKNNPKDIITFSATSHTVNRQFEHAKAWTALISSITKRRIRAAEYIVVYPRFSTTIITCPIFGRLRSA
jgi:ribonuclease D